MKRKYTRKVSQDKATTVPSKSKSKGVKMEILKPPTYNLEISFGGKDCILICQNVKRTLLNRFKYWMLCKFFPLKIERWDV